MRPCQGQDTSSILVSCSKILSRSVMVTTLDFDSSNPSSNLGETTKLEAVKSVTSLMVNNLSTKQTSQFDPASKQV